MRYKGEPMRSPLPHAATFLLLSFPLLAQTHDGKSRAMPSVQSFPVETAGAPTIVHETNPLRPFSVTGPRGALLGQQDGSYEAWIFPWKIFSDLRMTANMRDYPVPIDVNGQASTIEVQPDHTTITFAHANFTVRETLFAPQHGGEGGGAAAVYQIEAVRPMDLTFSFTPEMKLFWPAQSDVRPSPEWVPTVGGSGFYMLHLDFPDHASALAIPGAEPGILQPYQERPKTYPLQFILHFDPAKDGGKVYPLLMATADTEQTATGAVLGSRLLEQSNQINRTFAGNQSYYRDFLGRHTAIETPDRKLDDAFTWAEEAINQLRVEVVPSHAETALVAGFFTSGDSARPGFGWFFGRDALWTLYAVDSYGDAKLARDEVEFLLKRQQPDGKIIHEWSQAADLVDWNRFGYKTAAADATPLLLMVMADYLRVTGDRAFIEQHWSQIGKAWTYETTHDSDGDGIYENTQGTGWVESWPPGMPHQEIYLAALDEQASTAYARLARALGHAEVAEAAEKRADHIKVQIEREYYLPASESYAFSRNADGTTDDSATIFPTVAWWDGTMALDRAAPMLGRWASAEFSTDWGTRDLSPKSSFYDPISYHQGTVWPLYTGWTSVAEYRSGRDLSAYAHLRQNADLTWAQDLGDVTELLSGEFFAPLGRSTSHQLWSSAMVITPILRGLFGIEWDAAENTLTVTPHLPAEWDRAAVLRLPLGVGTTDLRFERSGTVLLVRASSGVRLRSRVPGAVSGSEGVSSLRIPLPAVEVSLTTDIPLPGARTEQMKVLDQQVGPRSLMLRLAAPAGSKQSFRLRRNDPKVKLRSEEGLLLKGDAEQTVELDFGAGQSGGGRGYVERTVRFTW